MRIMLTCQRYPPVAKDGIATATEATAAALASAGHEVHVLAARAGQRRSDETKDGVRVHRRGLPRLGKVPKYLFVWSTTIRLLRQCVYWHARRLGIEPEVVVVPNFEADGLLFVLTRRWPLAVVLHTPFALESGEPAPLRPVDKWVADRLDRWTARRADVVVSDSRFHLRRLREIGWIDHSSSHVVWHCLPKLGLPARVEPPSACEPVVLQVGRLERRKAPELTIEALALLQAEGVRVHGLFVGGNGDRRAGSSYLEWTRRLAAARGVSAEFTDEISDEALSAAYRRARVVVMPSAYESFGLTPPEALQYGRPAVVSDRVGFAEVLHRSIACRVFPYPDARAFADALRPFLIDAALADEAGEQGRRLAAEVLAPKKHAEAMEACLRAAIERFGAGSGRRAEAAR